MFKFGIQNCVRKFLFQPAKFSIQDVEKVQKAFTQLIRNVSFFNRVTADELWKGVTSVSNAGMKRGRGKGTDRKTRINLNIGQRIGLGKKRILWPGLNTPVVGQTTKNLIKIQPIASEPEEEKAPIMPRRRRGIRTHPMERGWTATSTTGRKFGPPDPRGDETFEEFESVVIDLHLRQVMDGALGRKRNWVCMAVVGNKNGLIGFGKAVGLDSKAIIRRAKNQAIQKLIAIDLIEKHTVNHDFYSQFGHTRVFVFRRPKGFGLKCHRALRECCQLIGIEDLSVKVEGAKNLTHILRAFLLGLLRQKTYQEIADDKKLHLVELKAECHNFPKVLASPKEFLTESQARMQVGDFRQYIMGDRVIWPMNKYVPFYEKLPSWTTHLKRTLYRRNHEKVERELIEHYGKVRSHLSKAYPECVAPLEDFKRSPKEETTS